MDELKENLKTLLRKAINNAKEDTVDGKKGRWITVKGTHVFIPDGENQEEVVKKFLEDKGSKSETKDEQGSEGKEKSEKKKVSDFEKNASRYPNTPDELEQIKSSIKKYFKSDANDKSVSVKELTKTFSLYQYNIDDIIEAAQEAGYEVKGDVIYRKKTNNSIQNGLSEIIKNCKPETEQDLKILKGLEDILSGEE